VYVRDSTVIMLGEIPQRPPAEHSWCGPNVPSKRIVGRVSFCAAAAQVYCRTLVRASAYRRRTGLDQSQPNNRLENRNEGYGQ
jgi:hypothetical protein